MVIRKVEKQNAARDSSSSNSTSPEDTSSSASVSSTSSLDLPNTKPTGPLQWVIYSAKREEDEEKQEKSRQLTKTKPFTPVDPNASNTQIVLLQSLKQNHEEASINFFFRYYTGTIYDTQFHNNFALLWQPLYLASSATSPIRLATMAVTVNITMMWSLRGCDARPARKLFTEALAAMREAINDPSPEDMDALLMAVLIFDLYDSMVLHYVHDSPSTYGKHKDGALALIKHRGLFNPTSERGKALTSASRHCFIGYSLSKRTPMPPASVEAFQDLSEEDSKAGELDAISTHTVNTLARLWTLRRDSSLSASPGDRRLAFENIIAEAIRIDEMLMSWRRSITSEAWLPIYITRDEVAPSILAAGFYGPRCAVWMDLLFAEMCNLYAIRRVATLQLIRQAAADEPSLLADPKYRAYVSQANATIQTLVDSILETIPFHVGDNLVPTVPLYSGEIQFPYKVLVNHATGLVQSVPDVEGTDYRMRAAASGGWMIFSHLVDLFRLMEPEDDAAPLVVREGQLDWLKGQIKRMQTTHLYCDPVW